MIKLVYRKDAHLAGQSPQSRKDDYAESILAKLRQTVEIAEEENADALLDGGDLFHVKAPTRNPHYLTTRLIEAHYSRVRTYLTPGNHDVVYGDMQHLAQQPLEVLFASGAIRRLYGEHEAVFERDGLKVRVVGVAYPGREYDKSILDIKKKDEDYLVVSAHLLASSEGGSMFENEDIISYSDLKGLDASVVLFSHWHKNQGIVEFAPGKWVVNIGALSRGSLIQDNVERTPSVAVLSFTKEGIQVVERPLKVLPADEVFDLQGRVRAEARTMTIEDFVTHVDEMLSPTVTQSLAETVRNLPDIPEAVREKTLDYIERAKVV